MPRRPLPPTPTAVAVEASDPAENPTAVRITDGEAFIDGTAVPTDEDGNRVAIELRDGRRLMAVFMPETDKLLRRVLERLDTIANLLTERE